MTVVLAVALFLLPLIWIPFKTYITLSVAGLAMGMLLGSLLGIQIGALTTKVVKGIYIRGFYATAIIAGFLNRFFALPKKLNQMEYISISKELANALDFIGLIVFFVIVGIFGIWVFSMFFKNLDTLRGKETLPQASEEVA